MQSCNLWHELDGVAYLTPSGPASSWKTAGSGGGGSHTSCMASTPWQAPGLCSHLCQSQIRARQNVAGRGGQGGAGQGRAGQVRAGQGRAGQGRAGQGRAGQGRAGQGRAGQGRAGQGRAGQGRAGQGRADWVESKREIQNSEQAFKAQAVLSKQEKTHSTTSCTVNQQLR